MNQLQIFNFENKEVRTIVINDVPWFVASDICQILDIQNTTQAISKLDDDERSMFNIGRQGNINIVNEFGLYSLVLSSRKPEAKEFKRWITHDVIPSIQKHGAYMTPETLEKSLSDPDFIIGLATKLKIEQLKRKELEITNSKLIVETETMKPKALFADSVAISGNSILIGELAKLLKQNGVDIGQNRLFEDFRRNGYLIRRGSDYNMPTQKSMELGIMKVKEGTHIAPDGSVLITRTTKITGKGQIYFVNRYVNAMNAERIVTI